MLLTLVLLAGSALGANPLLREGIIEGVVIHATDQTPVAGAEVVLRATVDGQLVSVAEIVADAQGRFRFDRLPTDGANVYLPGANHDGIHYPGAGVRLNSLRRRANVKLAVHDAVAFPNPLVVRRHTITLSPEPSILRVTESMSIDNPSAACYVGQVAGENVPNLQPVTLQLAIPSDFEQVTFASEYFGRRFSLIDGRLATGVPWPPGQRELTFSYVLANTERRSVWQRPLDLPSANVQVSVCTDQPEQATSNLSRRPREKDGLVTFKSDEHPLPAGYLLRVEMGDLPVSAMAHASWAALALLGGLILVTSVLLIARGKRTRPDRDPS
jgi:hypothetical protein